MNTFAIATIFAVLAAANASLIAAPSTRIIQGPSTRTTVAGPDGSVISAVAPGGSIVTEDHAALVAHTAPVVAAAPVLAARTAYAAPVVATHAAYAAPVVAAHSAYSAPVLAAHTAYAAPVLARTAYAAPALGYASHGVVSHSADTVVAGPSGTVATRNSVHSPAVLAHGLYY